MQNQETGTGQTATGNTGTLLGLTAINHLHNNLLFAVLSLIFSLSG
jgi:hypothetical protein